MCRDFYEAFLSRKSLIVDAHLFPGKKLGLRLERFPLLESLTIESSQRHHCICDPLEFPLLRFLEKIVFCRIGEQRVTDVPHFDKRINFRLLTTSLLPKLHTLHFDKSALKYQELLTMPIEVRLQITTLLECTGNRHIVRFSPLFPTLSNLIIINGDSQLGKYFSNSTIYKIQGYTGMCEIRQDKWIFLLGETPKNNSYRRCGQIENGLTVPDTWKFIYDATTQKDNEM